MSNYPYQRILEVDGMSCGDCVVRIENALNSLDGIYARVDLKVRRANVCMKQDCGDESLKAAVRAAGYRVIRIECIK